MWTPKPPMFFPDGTFPIFLFIFKNLRPKEVEHAEGGESLHLLTVKRSGQNEVSGQRWRVRWVLGQQMSAPKE